MLGSILFHNLNDIQITIYIGIIRDNQEYYNIDDLVKQYNCNSRDVIINLVTKGFLKKKGNQVILPNSRELTILFLEQEYKYRSTMINPNEDGYLTEIKSYLSTAQKQLTHVETESRKSFLNLRKMVDKISEQGKNHLDIAFNKALERNMETGEWISIPHISPVGLYEPIEDLKNKFKVIINELEISMENLLKEYSATVIDILTKLQYKLKKDVEEDNENKDELIDFAIKSINKKEESLLKETQIFNEEVLIALFEQINLLEKNLGKDLIEQLDAIERLNELKPERIWVMLEETRSELMVYLNNVYSRLLREINTLQLDVDFSKISLILTNEAGKAIKKVDQIQQDSIDNLKPLGELIRNLEGEL